MKVRGLLVAAFCVGATLHGEGPCSQPSEGQSLTLEGAERFALRQNPSLRSLRHQVQGGAYNQRNARSKWAPQLSVSAEAERSGSGKGSGSSSYNQRVSAKQTLYNAGTYYGVCAADLDARGKELDLLLSTNDLLFDVRRAYYDCVVAQEEVEVQRENVDILSDALEREEKKFKVGETTKFEVRQSTVSVANALSSYYAAVRRMKVAKNTLLNLMGEDPHIDSNLAVAACEVPVLSVPFLREKAQQLGWEASSSMSERDDLIRETFSIYSGESPSQAPRRVFSQGEVQTWQEKALENRPAMKKATLALHQACNTLRTKKGEWHPSISGFASGSHDSDDEIRFTADGTSWEFGASVSWTLFDGFGRQSRIGEAKAKLCAAQGDYDRVVRATKVAIQNSFHELEESLLSYFAASQSVALAEEAIHLAQNRRSLGVITPLEYRDVAASLTSARQNLNRASFTLLTSYYNLRRQAGVDVKDESCLLLGCAEELPY